ncbi:MAG: formimidoylglutamase [Phycisphaerae bacterium]|nr:formimidoylglutamase [Phycisphaerae bacterium]
MPTIPHCSPPQWPAPIGAGRFASRIGREAAAGCAVALLGLPDCLGVRLNGGRPGASEGPAAFRAALARYGAAEPCGWAYPGVFDAGDVLPATGMDEASLHETHRRISEASAALAAMGLVPVAIGGGHDLTFPFVRGVISHLRANKPPAVFEGVYVDAHLDVRETVGSGMPFRRLVEDCGVRALDLFGFSPFVNTPAHREWFIAHGGRLHEGWPGAIPSARSPGAARFMSVDLDAIDAAHAPGVSAENPCGAMPGVVAALAESAGRSDDVVCFDIMELSPRHDHADRTARLAAHLFLSFLRGFAQRGRSA